MVLSNKFFNSDDCCCPPDTGCCCPNINVGSFDLHYETTSTCEGFDGLTGCMIRGADEFGCTLFTATNIEDCPTSIGFTMTLKCWSLTERTGYPPTDTDVIPPNNIEYGYRLCTQVSSSACTGVPSDILDNLDSGCYKPVINLFDRPQCDPFRVIFNIPLPYQRPDLGGGCDCCDEGETVEITITSGCP